MSLDVYLTLKGAQIPVDPHRIYIREAGATRAVSLEDWRRRSGDPPIEVTLDSDRTDTVFEANITHNLGKMAGEADLYMPLWRPDQMEPPLETGADLIGPLRHGLEKLRADPAHFRTFNPSNGWGNYDQLLRFVEDYLEACEEYPHATIYASR